MSIVDEVKRAIGEQFDQWATTVCPDALRGAIEDTCQSGAHRTGGLVASVDYTKVSDKEYIIGTTAHYGGYVNDGRGAVRPHGKYPLHWTAPSGEEVFRMRSGPSRPRNFIALAVTRVS